MKQDNPFAKLGALDQKLYQDTTPKPHRQEPQSSGIPDNQNSSNQEFQKSRKLDFQNTRNQDNKNTSIQDIQNAIIPETQKTRIPENPALAKPAKREFYTKATYRLCDEALDAIEDAKKILKRQFGLKVNLEEIVETAVLEAYKDLSEKGKKAPWSPLILEFQKTRILDCQFYRYPESQNTGILSLEINLISPLYLPVAGTILSLPKLYPTINSRIKRMHTISSIATRYSNRRPRV